MSQRTLATDRSANRGSSLSADLVILQPGAGQILPLFLVAPYSAKPRDYLSGAPLLSAMGFSVSQNDHLGVIHSPPSLPEPFRLGGHSKWRCDPPPPKGYLSDTCAIPHENKAEWVRYFLCDAIPKGYCAIWGGISHWAAKPLFFSTTFKLGAHRVGRQVSREVALAGAPMIQAEGDSSLAESLSDLF